MVRIGFGHFVRFLTHITRLDRLASDDCGCSERAERWNKWKVWVPQFIVRRLSKIDREKEILSWFTPQPLPEHLPTMDLSKSYDPLNEAILHRDPQTVYLVSDPAIASLINANGLLARMK